MTPNGSRESLFDRPSDMDTSIVNAFANTEAPTPLCNRASFAIDGNEMIVTAVVRLFIVINPSAIIRFVITRIVDALNRVTWRRLWPHIGVKSIELLPAFTNPNAAASVKRILTSIRVLASLFHSAPGIVFWRIAFPMRFVSRRKLFTAETTTTQGSLTYESASLMSADRATIATANPVRCSVMGVRKSNHSPATIMVANDILNIVRYFCHSISSFWKHYTMAYTLVQV